MSGKNQVVFIMTDTQGANVVGCYGRPYLKTPCLDRLAGQGVRFDKAYTACPVCGPARAALFTGTYPHTNGSWGNCLPIGDNVKTVGQRLKDSGVHTAYIGKWHLSGTDYFDDGICPDGWDEAYWYDGRRYLEELSEEERLRWRQELNTAEAVHRYGMTESFTWAHRNSDRALGFLANHGDESFFLVVSYDEPHGPFTCPPPYCDMFQDFEYALEENVGDPLADKPVHQQQWAAAANLPREQRRLKRPMYFGCNSFVDYEIGRVLDAVDRHAPGALVIFTSDHGTPLLSHGLPSKGPAMYDETTRIPFIVRWPERAPAGSVCSHPVSHIDIVPTVLDAFGLESPPYLEGRSMVKGFEDPEVRLNDVIFFEFSRYELNHDGFGGFQPIRCAFDGRHKLVVNLHYTDELYDLEEDPHEMKNLIGSEAYSGVRDGLHDRILDWMDRTRDPFRGHIWEQRPWKRERRMGFGAAITRPRPDDGYEPRVFLYETGLPVDRWVYDKRGDFLGEKDRKK